MDDFDIDRSTDEAWDAFGGRLSEVLSMMDGGAELTLGTLAPDDDASPFIAYECPALGRLVAQASSNAVLADDYQLAAPQLGQMEELGWLSPSADSSENFTSEWSQEQTDGLAVLSVATMRDVYGVLHPVFLTADQLADVLQPPGPSEPPYRSSAQPADGADTHAVMPADAAELDRLVGTELARRWVRFWLLRDKVFVSMSALARPFVPAHFHQVVHEVASVADIIDDHLAATLRGRTTFSTPED